VLPEEHAALQAHAIADLTTFLRLRAEEFRPGGLLVLGLVSCHAEAGPDGSWCGAVAPLGWLAVL
jgi:hypothetical protein